MDELLKVIGRSGNYQQLTPDFDAEKEFDALAIEFGHLDQSITRDTKRWAEIKPKYQELCGEYTGHEWDENYVTCVNCGIENPRIGEDND